MQSTAHTDTNQLNHVDASKISIQDSLAGAKLSQEQKNQLLNGDTILVTGMKRKNGESFDAKVAYNAVNKGLVFIPDKSKTQKQNMQQTTKKSKSITS